MSQARPTDYAGIRFRSRAEARWAAFFDEVRWPWLYEPLDLHRYIPDFILQFKRPLLVEVKGGALTEDEIVTGAWPKIARSGWGGGALMLGAAPVGPGGGFGAARLGLYHHMMDLAPNGPAWCRRWGDTLSGGEDLIVGDCHWCQRPSLANDLGYPLVCELCHRERLWPWDSPDDLARLDQTWRRASARVSWDGDRRARRRTRPVGR